MGSTYEAPRDVLNEQHETPNVTKRGILKDPSFFTTPLTSATGDCGSLVVEGDPATPADSSSSPRRHRQVVKFQTPPPGTPQAILPSTPNTNWSTWVSPSYSSPSYQDPSNRNSHSSYTISQPQIHSNSNNTSRGDGSGSKNSAQQPYQHPRIMKMKYPFGFNPQTPPQQTAGYYHPTPSPPLSTPLQQQYQLPYYPPRQQHQQQMPPPPMTASGPYPPGPPQHYQPQPQMMPGPSQYPPSMPPQNMANPMQAWYNSIPQPEVGPFEPPIPLMRGTQFLPGLSSMHPVEAQYMMYIATKRWQASPYAETTFPNFAAMPLPSLSVNERKEMEDLRECFDNGRFPSDMQNKQQQPPPKNKKTKRAADNSNGNGNGNGNGAAAAVPTNGCCHHHCCGNHAAAAPANGNGNNQAPADESSSSPSSSASSSTSSSSEEEEEDPEARRQKDWTDHAWFDIFGTLYPPTRRFTADQFWSRRDCRILAIMESKYEGVKWAEFSAQFCNATGRYVAPEYIRYKMESDGVPIGSDDEDSDEGYEDEFAVADSSSDEEE
ncbi:hypothetical protein PG993_013841 [Apiospora rasikravindrae]|uniref:Myb-like domain-containing protein n=1 Tax=Apiospora rasikravindrae TaxID=990691 RepID=A0ABR1RRC6_9PEZI